MGEPNPIGDFQPMPSTQERIEATSTVSERLRILTEHIAQLREEFEAAVEDAKEAHEEDIEAVIEELGTAIVFLTEEREELQKLNTDRADEAAA